MLVLEDIHWADSSTRDLLRFLVRNARDERVMILGSYRSDELHRRHPLLPLLAELERTNRVDVLELGAFGPDELAAQVSAIIGRHAEPPLVEAVLSRSGGNPFFAEELLASRAGRPRTAAQPARHARGPGPWSRRRCAAGDPGRIGLGGAGRPPRPRAMCSTFPSLA